MKLSMPMTLTSNYFSGFCFQNESELFNEYLQEGVFFISGFSFGAQKAFEYALNTTSRVDTLQLLSPAFFQNKDEKYKRMQLMFFKKDSHNYCETFLKNVLGKSTKNIEQYFVQGTYEELNDLLTYVWEKEKLEKLLAKGTKIEVFLGGKDEIIDSSAAYEFFKEYATVYFIKDVSHIL